MHILLGILSVIGFVLLIILLIIIALLAMILFLPVVYRVKVLKNGTFLANGSVRWLFGALSFKFSFVNGRLNYMLRIFGVPIKKLQKKANDNTQAKIPNVGSKPFGETGKTEYEPAKKQPTIKPGEIISEEPESDEKKIKIEISEEQLKKDYQEKKTPLTDKIKFKIKSICDKLKKVKSILDLISKIKDPVIKLIKSIMPKKVKGYINFGFDDPSRTGMVYAVLGALCVPIPRDLALNPDFENGRFECDVKISGRIFIINIAICAVKLFMIPEFRELLGFSSTKNGTGGKKRKHSRKRVKKYKARIRQGGKHD